MSFTEFALLSWKLFLFFTLEEKCFTVNDTLINLNHLVTRIVLHLVSGFKVQWLICDVQLKERVGIP